MNMKILFLIVMTFNIAWDTFLEVLDHRSLKNKIPASVADVYNQEEYQKWRSYNGENKRIGVINSVLSYVLSIALVLTDCYARFASLFPANIYWQLFSVILLSTIVSTVVGIPFSIYSTFVIEEKYGFNKTTPKTFVLDTIKGFVIGLILEGGLISAFAAIHQVAGSWFIPALAGTFVLISLILSFVSPALTRIFNKFKPLDDGELKTRLTELLTSHGYKVRAVEVMDASRRSTRVNAYFTGIGPTKTIVLYDTMMDVMTDDQICAVFAHEMGHGIHHDIAWNWVFSVLNSFVIAGAAWIVVSNPAIFADFGFNGINYGFAFVLLNLLTSIISPLVNWLSSLYSRYAEYRADATAADEGYGEALISGLKLLSKKNLSNLAPDPLLVKLTYSHPTLAQRIEAIEKRIKNKKD